MDNRTNFRRRMKVVFVAVAAFVGYISEPGDNTKATAINERITQEVKSLEYLENPEEVARTLIKMAENWRLDDLSQKFTQSRREYREGKLSNTVMCKLELLMVGELNQIICEEIVYEDMVFDLADIVAKKKANCLGYTQLFFILGNAVGFSVEPISMRESVGFDLAGESHAACLVKLSDNRYVFMDVTTCPSTVSEQFALEERFRKEGHYWELRDGDNLLKGYRKIRILGRNGLVAFAYYQQGEVSIARNDYTEAILSLSKAIEFDSTFVSSYASRGSAYRYSGKYSEAILDYTTAIRCDSLYAPAYFSRGNAHTELASSLRISDPIEANKHYYQAITDYNKAVELCPGMVAVCYWNRGNAYLGLRNYPKAISEYTRVIRIFEITGSTHAQAYYGRGLAHIFSGDRAKAKEDLNKALQINPELKHKIQEILNDLE